MTRQAITKHLRVLDEAGLVHSVRRGREQIWSLETRELARARTQLAAIARGWDDALRRLKALVEDER